MLPPIGAEVIGDLALEMEKAKSLREIALDVVRQMANFGFLAKGTKCRESHGGNRTNPRKCAISFEKSVRNRH